MASLVMGRRFQVAVCVDGEIVAHRVYEAGSTVTIGTGTAVSLAVDGWEGPDLELISAGMLLRLQPGMRLLRSMNNGEGCVPARTYEELQSAGVELPLHIDNPKLNIGVRPGVSVFVRYLGDADVPWQPPP